MSINVTAKSKVYISAAAFNADPVLGDYEAQSWVEIGEVTNLGSWGAKGKEITSVVISDAYTRRLKGSIDSGTVSLVVNRDPFDAGQQAAQAGANAWDTFLFKVQLNDKIIDSGTDSLFYFRASVMSAENKFDGADSIIETTFMLGITGAIIEVPASVTVTFTPAAGAITAATHSTPYTATIAATGGVGSPSYAVIEGALPAGLTLNAATGVISGTPSAAGSANFTIEASFGTDGGSGVAAYTLAVS